MTFKRNMCLQRLIAVLVTLVLASTAPAANAQEAPAGAANATPTTPPALAQPSLPMITSRNWAGYIATTGTFTGVNGTWTVPNAASIATPSVISTWVGVGGVHVSDLLEAGTEARVNSLGSVQYQAWIELLPSAEQTVALTVHPGDVVNVDIAQQSSNNWQIAFTDRTTGQAYSQTVQYTSSNSSAEWIQGLASIGRLGGNLVPFDAFTPVTFVDGTATQDGQHRSIAEVASNGVALVGADQQILAAPSEFDVSGSGFTISRIQPAPPPAASVTVTGPLFEGTPDAIMVQPGDVGSGWTVAETRQDLPNQYSSGRRWLTLAQGGSRSGGPVLEVEVEVFRDVQTAVAAWTQRQDPLGGQSIGTCDADWLWVRSDTVQLHCREANVEMLIFGPTVDVDNAALAAMLRRIKPATGA